MNQENLETEDILLIGGSDIDYLATPKKKLIYKDSNIGSLHVSFGGVMRNITENLARLGIKPLFITPLGDDQNGKDILEHMTHLGVKVLSPIPHYPTATYLAINNENNDLEIAVVDSRVFANLNWSYLIRMKTTIDLYHNIVIDSNLDIPTIQYIVDNYKDRRLFVEGVSAAKIVKFRDFLSYLSVLSCNYLEAKTLIGQDLEPEQICQAILDKGVLNAIVTNGANGIYFGSKKAGVSFLKADKIENVVSTNGAGDALYSGVIYSLLKGRSLKEGVKLGKRMADLTIKCEETNSCEVDMLADI
ncbi:MAG: carbohydrate kinase family protein [Bacilli bacterium]|jgi:pseudouridine kinase|nr:carbohydrate kinase family protein [Bacilli bacterium]